MSVSLPSVGLVYALLFLVPGFLSYRTARRLAKITTPVDKFDKGIYTVMGSGVSLSIVVIIHSLISDYQIDNITNQEFVVSTLGVLYISTLAISLVLGAIVGLIVDKSNTGDIRIEPVWQLIAEGKEEPARVRATMNNGDEIWGEVLATDSDPHGQDLLLKYPMRVVRDSKSKITEEEPIGDYVFLSQSDISHIYFETDIDISASSE